MTPPEEDRRKLDLPDRRQHTYEALSQRLDEHIEAHEKALEEQAEEHKKALEKQAEHSEERLSRFFAKALIAFAVIGMISAGSLFGFGFVLNSIQNQRKTYIRISCKDTNERHDKTTNKLVALSKADEDARTTEKAKAEVRRRRDVTLGLIDALAPHENCEKKVNLAVDEGK